PRIASQCPDRPPGRSLSMRRREREPGYIRSRWTYRKPDGGNAHTGCRVTVVQGFRRVNSDRRLRPTGVSMRVPHAEAGAEARIVNTARGRMVVWDTPGPVDDAPPLVLLHGVTLDAATNWSGAVPALAQHFRVLALDLRGHGGGPPSRVPYRLEDCADDAAAAVDAMDVG